MKTEMELKLLEYEQEINKTTSLNLIMMVLAEKQLTKHIKSQNINKQSFSFKARTILRRRIKELMQ